MSDVGEARILILIGWCCPSVVSTPPVIKLRLFCIFANGSAETIDAIVDFYDRQFRICFSKQERQDLVNFLSVL
jgi:hypothetical protein